MGKRSASLCAAWVASACAVTPLPHDGASVSHSDPVVRDVLSRRDDESPPRGVIDGPTTRALVYVARLRQLSVLRAVPAARWSRVQMATELTEQVASHVPAEVIDAEREMFVLLGAAPPAFDLLAATTALLTSELAGFYDPAAGQMVIAEDLPREQERVTLSHELVHALQDQHWGLADLMKYEPDATDRKSARHTLAEGDATSAMLDDVLRASGNTAPDIPDVELGRQLAFAASPRAEQSSIPPLLWRSAMAPYVDGVKFVNGLRREGGWAAVDAAWRNPPQTTEQLLHVEKYRTREPAEAVPLPVPPSGDGWARYHHDVLGERGVSLWLEEWARPHVAGAAAAGWAGDRIALFRASARRALGWHLAYDDEAGAAHAYVVLGRAMGLVAAPCTSDGCPLQACSERAEIGPLAVTRAGRHLSIVAGPISRNGPRVTSESTCVAALAWGADVLKGHGADGTDHEDIRGRSKDAPPRVTPTSPTVR